MVNPVHKILSPEIVTLGLLLTVIGADGLDVHPEAASEYVNVASPTASAITIPSFVTVAIEGLLLNHVPPDDGDKVEVEPIQIKVDPVIKVDGLESTEIGSEALEIHPVTLSIKVKVALPIVNPVTNPRLLTLATLGLLLVQVPPDVGES